MSEIKDFVKTDLVSSYEEGITKDGVIDQEFLDGLEKQ